MVTIRGVNRSSEPQFESQVPHRKHGNFVVPILPVSFGKDTKTVYPFYLVPMPGEVKDST